MKVLDKIGLAVFSTIVLIISLILCAVIIGVSDIYEIAVGINNVLDNTLWVNILFGVQLVLILLAIKCIFFNSSARERSKNRAAITLENNEGKLVVSRDVIENLASLVAKSYEGIENVSTKVEVDDETNIRIIVNMQVLEEVKITEITNRLQSNIKDSVKKSLNLEVKEVIVKVKDIAVKKKVDVE